MRAWLFGLLEQTAGMSVPLYPDRGFQANLRHRERSKLADFPPELTRHRGRESFRGSQ